MGCYLMSLHRDVTAAILVSCVVAVIPANLTITHTSLIHSYRAFKKAERYFSHITLTLLQTQARSMLVLPRVVDRRIRILENLIQDPGSSGFEMNLL